MNIVNLISRFPTGISQGIIWGIMALGIYITYKVLKLADLTVDGSFVSGGAVCVMLIINGVNPWLTLIISFIVGFVAGCLTGFIHTFFKIPSILSGILMQFVLYSFNLVIMNMRANQALNPDKYNLVLSVRKINESIFIGLLIAIVIIAIMYWFFGTEIGSSIRATGDNIDMSLAQGININTMKILGLAIGNGLVALSGALLTNYQGYCDLSMGKGAIVIGLAAIIIGDVLCNFLFKKGASFYTRLFFTIIGGVLYYISMIIILWFKVDSNHLKLFTALIVLCFLSVPNMKKGEMYARD